MLLLRLWLLDSVQRVRVFIFALLRHIDDVRARVELQPSQLVHRMHSFLSDILGLHQFGHSLFGKDQPDSKPVELVPHQVAEWDARGPYDSFEGDSKQASQVCLLQQTGSQTDDWLR